MINYTSQRFKVLCEAYLSHIEATTNPIDFIKDLMKRFWKVPPHMDEYLRLLLQDPVGRAVLGAFCVHMHYVSVGRNIMIEGIGIPSIDQARKIHSTVSALAQKAENIRIQCQNSKAKRERKKVNVKNAEAALVRKEIKTLNGEITQLKDQMRKKIRQVNARMTRLAEIHDWLIKYTDPDNAPYADEIVAATARMNEWLKPYGYRVACQVITPEDEPLEDGCLGCYVSGSIFSKVIEIIIDPERIETACGEDSVHDRYSDPAIQIEITLYHELGHAITEQIMDWLQYNEDFQALQETKFGTDYMDILYDYIPEEDLVEDFAWGLFEGKASPLQRCFQEAAEHLSKI